MSIQKTKLKNGLVVITDKMPEVQTASLGFWIKAGSVCEQDANNGAAHFFEHMAFKGTEKRSALDISLEIERLGGYFNAYTSREVTAYYGKVLSSDAHVLVDVLSDMLQNSTLDQEEMERERTVILQELMQSIDTPDDIIFDYFQEHVFGKHSLARPILGSEETIKAMTPEVLREFITRYYSPSRTVMVASGDVDHDTIVSYIEKSYSIPPNELPLSDSEEPIHQGGTHHYCRKEMKQAQLIWGCRAPKIGAPLADAWMFTNILLSGGMSSRLVYEVREKFGLVYTISTFYSAFKEAGLWGMYAGTSNEEIKKVLRLTIEQVRDLAENGPTDEEMEQARKQIYAQSFMRWESSGSRARSIAEFYLHKGEIFDSAIRVKELCATTKDEVRRVAADILSSLGTCVILSADESGVPVGEDWASWGVKVTG